MHVNVTGIYKCFLEAFSTFYLHQTGTGVTQGITTFVANTWKYMDAFVHS